MAIGKLSFSLLVFHLSYSLSAYADVPEKCKRPPLGDAKPHECCKVPEMFPVEDIEGCGFQKVEELKKSGVTGPPEQGAKKEFEFRKFECEKIICLYKKYNLMKDDQVDMDAVGGFLDTWAEKYQEFKGSVDAAKKTCLKKPIPGPSAICDPNKLAFCIGGAMFYECPSWEESESCHELRNYIDECKPFFKRT